MRKFLSLALALALCLGLTVPAYATGKAGDTTVTDSQGNVYTLSQPIIQVFSREDIDEIPFAEDYGRIISDDEYEEVAPADSLLSQVKVAYEVPVGTVVTAPSGVEFDGFGLVELDLVNDETTAVYEMIEPPFLRELELDYRDLDWYNTFWILSCNAVTETQSGNQGKHIDDIVFYTTESAAPTAPAAPTTPSKPAFTDVAADSPYADAIAWAVAQGITNGKTATTFGTKDTCTISHILTFLWRANGRPGAKEGEAERDSVLRWANGQGMAVTADMLSSPCTRARAVNFMWMAAGKPQEKETIAFTDVEPGDFTKGIAWAVEKGVTQGTSATTFSPDNICTRGQIVTFLYRAFK